MQWSVAETIISIIVIIGIFAAIINVLEKRSARKNGVKEPNTEKHLAGESSGKRHK